MLLNYRGFWSQAPVFPDQTAEGPSAVTVISQEDIARHGFTTIYEALNTLSQTVGNTHGELSSNSFAANAEVVDLRGLGPGRTLVLINGRRTADYPAPYGGGENNFVNLVSIPAVIVDRIEVLAGGASAIYGSDAVAGVVNIILRDDLDGMELAARVGDTTQGGADSLRLQAAGGLRRDKFSIGYALEYLDRARLNVADRDFMDSTLDRPDGAGQPNPSISVRDFFTNTRQDTGLDCGQFPELQRVVGSNTPGPFCGRFDEDVFRSTLRNERENLSGHLAYSYELTSATELYGAARYWTSNAAYNSGVAGNVWASALEDGGGVFLDDDFFSSGPNPILGLALRFFQGSEVPGGNEFFDRRFEEESAEIVLGIRGPIFSTRFNYDLAISLTDYDLERVGKQLKEEVVNDFFQGPRLGFFAGLPVYDFNYERFNRPIVADEVDLLWGNSRVVSATSADQANVVITGDLLELPAGPVGVAAVAEWASQDYEITVDDRFLDTGGNGWFAAGASPVPFGERERIALGLELTLPLTKQLRTTLAGRYDNYDDITGVDGAITYNLGLEWRPHETLLLRAQRATSFKAPDMQFVFGSSRFFFTLRDPYRCRLEQPGVPLAQCTINNVTALGISRSDSNLVEEEGDSWTAGFVWELANTVSLSFDYFDIELINGVDNRGIAEILDLEADCRLGTTLGGAVVDGSSPQCQDAISRVIRRPADGSPLSEALLSATTGPVNRSRQKTQGFDATFRYRLDTRAGGLSLATEYSHVLESETEQFVLDAPITRDDPRNFAFRSRVRTTLNWIRNNWAATLLQNRVGSLPQRGGTARIGPHITYNAWISYQVSDKADLSLSIANLFDTNPPRDPTQANWPFYPVRSYSPIGREIFLQLDYSL